MLCLLFLNVHAADTQTASVGPFRLVANAPITWPEAPPIMTASGLKPPPMPWRMP